MVLDELKSALDQVCSTDPAALSDGESIVELHRCLARLEGATTRAVASFDARREWDADGARSAAAWLTGKCRLPRQNARRRVRLGRTLRHLPAAERTWLAGEVGEAQVAALARVRTPATEDVLADEEEMLVGQASSLRYDHFTRVLAYWCQHVDPDGAEDDAEAKRSSRRVHLSQGFGDLWFLDGVLDPLSGAIVSGALRRIADELFEADWAEARARRGEAATVADLGRSAAQRRHDAPGGDGTASRHRSRGWAPARAAVHRGGGLRDLPRAHLPAGQRHRGQSWLPGPVAGPGLAGAGGVRPRLPGDRRGGDPAAVHRSHPQSGAGARPGVLPSAVRRAGRVLPDRPRRAQARSARRKDVVPPSAPLIPVPSGQAGCAGDRTAPPRG